MRELFARRVLSFLGLVMLIAGCRSGKTYPYESESGIRAIVYQLKAQFGIGGRYSSIHLRYDDSSALLLTITGVPERNKDSLVVRRLMNGKWSQLSSVLLVSLDQPPILFSLDDVASLQNIPHLITKSINRMSTEVHTPGLRVKEVLVNAPADDPEGDPLRINLYIQPPGSIEKFEYAYNSKGELKGVQHY